MTIHNLEIADKFNKLANLLEIEGANPFRIRAYRNAARIIGTFPQNIADLVAKNVDLTELPSIGKDLAEKIQMLVNTGQFPLLQAIEERTPPILNALMTIPGLGPKRIQVIYKKLKIKTVDDVKIAIAKGRMRKLHGFGEKIEQKILQGIQHLDRVTQGIPLADAFPIATSIIDYLKSNRAVGQVECAGSFRRRKEMVGDLDIVVSATEGKKVIAHFVRCAEIAEIISQGITRSTVNLHSGIQVDLRVIPKESYGAALLYFTGSKAHNIAIRKMAMQKKLKINEYGVFKGKKCIAGRTEKEVYAQIGLPYIPPELREDRGEIAAAQQNRLPKLITLDDIRGDLHCHTQGKKNLEAMANAAESLGYEYLAITNPITDLDKKSLLAQIRAIEKLNARLKKLVILKSSAIAILEDGSLSLPNTLLKELDLTVCSIQEKFNLPQEKQTARIIRAMDNPYFTILAHPTNRLLHQREPSSIDIEHVMLAAKERGCILELNAQPERMDLNDVHCKLAKELGVNLTISAAAHSPSQFAYMQFGIYQARRGWLEKKNVINTYGLKELMRLLKR